MPESKKEKYSANSLARGLEILTLFNDQTPTLSLSEISHLLGVNRTVPYRLLYTLQSLGYLHQEEHTKRYQLTPKVLKLGFSYLNSLKFPEIAQPYLENLRDELGASCYLSILDGTEVVYVGTAPVRGITAVNVNIGLRLPAHATANGKLLLAFQPQEDLLKLFYSSDLTPYTTTTLTALTDLQQELKEIYQKGYATTVGEFNATVSSVAAPIFDRTGKVIAALNVVVTESAFPKNFIKEMALPRVLNVAQELSNYMGYTEK